jgi:hypothetical protein
MYYARGREILKLNLEPLLTDASEAAATETYEPPRKIADLPEGASLSGTSNRTFYKETSK